MTNLTYASSKSAEPDVSYRNPTLVEIYAEAHLEPGSFSPPSFFDLVPKLKDIGFKDVEFGNVDTLEINPLERVVEQATTTRIRCWSADRTRLVQLSADTVIVNLVGKYPGWTDFFRLFCSVHEATQSTLGRPRTDTLSLNTIDQFQAPLSTFSVGQYLNCGGKRIPPWYADTKEPFDISLGKGLLQINGFNRQLRVTGRPRDDAFVVRITSVFHDTVGSQSVEQLLSKLHEESNESFESLLTNITRNEIMGGAVQYADRS